MHDESHPERPVAAANLPGVAPERSLTLKARRLAGSAQCLNCGTVLHGPFCH